MRCINAILLIFLIKQLKILHKNGGCRDGSTGNAVGEHTRGLWFESRLEQTQMKNI